MTTTPAPKANTHQCEAWQMRFDEERGTSYCAACGRPQGVETQSGPDETDAAAVERGAEALSESINKVPGIWAMHSERTKDAYRQHVRVVLAAVAEEQA